MNIEQSTDFILTDILSGCFISVNKPAGWTSHDVVNKLRYSIRHAARIKKFKIGHAGTLDPMATGLLVLAAGPYTKQIHTVQGQEKIYTATLRLGATTPSYDAETEIDQHFPIDHLQSSDVDAILGRFIGEIQQHPPAYSALKVDGRRAYELARKGQAVRLAPRPVQIHAIDRLEATWPEVSLRVRCGKGTYIRSLAHDIGAALESGGHLTALRRDAIGDFRLAQAWDIEPLVERIRSQAITQSPS